MNTAHLSGAWRRDEIQRFLEDTRVPLRLGLLDRDGGPLVVSLWFAVEDGALWCATAADSYVARRLQEDPRCGFEVAPENPPYRGIRGRGVARLVPERGDEWRERLAHRYLGETPTAFRRWLLGQRRPETAVALVPETLRSWDYRARMGG